MTKKNLILKILLLILFSFVSIFFLSNLTSTSFFETFFIDTLDEKRNNILALTASSTAISAAITAVPGDFAMPIAEKLMDISFYFLIPLCAIYIEKFLLIISTKVVFQIIVPTLIFFYILNFYLKIPAIMVSLKKVALFSVILFLIVPTSIVVTKLIENTYTNTIAEAISSANETKNELSTYDDTLIENEETGLLSNIKSNFSNLSSSIKENISNISNSIKEKAENTFNNFIDALAIMIVTSFIIPLFVLFCLVKFINLIFNSNLNLNNPFNLIKKLKPTKKFNNENTDNSSAT